MEPRHCREQFLAEYELFEEQKKLFEEEMRNKNLALAKREDDLLVKMKAETESLQTWADRLITMEQVYLYDNLAY